MTALPPVAWFVLPCPRDTHSLRRKWRLENGRKNITKGEERNKVQRKGKRITKSFTDRSKRPCTSTCCQGEGTIFGERRSPEKDTCPERGTKNREGVCRKNSCNNIAVSRPNSRENDRQGNKGVKYLFLLHNIFFFITGIPVTSHRSCRLMGLL